MSELINTENLIEDIVVFIYQSFSSNVEHMEKPDYTIGTTISTNKYYVKFNYKLINYTFPKIPYLKVEFVNNKYVIDFDFSDPEDEVDRDIIKKDNLSNQEKILLLHSLRSKKLDYKIPEVLIEKYKQP